jgi:hypothetical protein
MAVPWQTDSASCLSGYDSQYDPYLPTFWPARVPNQVLSTENYTVVMDGKQPMGERLAAFARRAAWTSPLGTNSYQDQINNMVKHFGEMGVVEQRPGPGDREFPSVMEVESEPTPLHDELNARHGAGRSATALNLETTDKAKRFPNGQKYS